MHGHSEVVRGKEMDVSLLCHKFANKPRTVVEERGHFT